MRRRRVLELAGLTVAGAVLMDGDARPARPLRQTAVWGAYASPEPYPNCKSHYELEALLGARLPCMSWFTTWSQDFPSAGRDAQSGRYELLIAWMPLLNGGRAVPFADILSGAYDPYVTRFFAAAKRYGYPVTIRFAHEMNLGHHVYSVGGGGPTSAAEFVATWRYLHRHLQQMEAPNTQLLWCISNVDGPIPAEQYYPGTEFVDKVGFDGYSGFTSRGWTEPRRLIEPSYRRLRKLSPGRPIWLCEVGCRQTTAADADRGHDKARWLDDLFSLNSFPALSHVVFFHKNKEQDWRLNSSPASLHAARAALRHGRAL